jgi:hypothetical protein
MLIFAGAGIATGASREPEAESPKDYQKVIWTGLLATKSALILTFSQGEKELPLREGEGWGEGDNENSEIFLCRDLNTTLQALARRLFRSPRYLIL